MCLCVAVAFWYKPDASHRHLYPTAKDENGAPIKVITDGEAEFKVCPNGIEVFCRVSGPQGVPLPAEFAAQVKDPSKVTWQPAAPHTATHCTQCTCITYCMRLKLLSFALPNHRPDSTRFDPADGEANVNKIIKALPATFTAAHIASWEAFFSIYPAAVEDILEERLLPVRTDALPPCSTQLALSSLARHQVRYAQTKHLCMHAHVCTLWLALHKHCMCTLWCRPSMRSLSDIPTR